MKKNKIVYFLLLFLAFQPIIDILTTFSIQTLNTDATFGLLIRVAYLLISTVFILSQFKQSTIARISLYYLSLIGVFIVINLAINFYYKPHFYLLSEIKFIIKTFYAVIVFISLFLALEYFRKHKMNYKQLFLKVLMVSSITIGTVMIVSILTNTSLSSYDYTKSGYAGWFFAGNEIGAICAMILPIVSYYAISKTSSIKKIYTWIPFILVGYSLIMFGTKVGYLSLFAVFLVSIFTLIIALLSKKNQPNKRKLLLNFGITLVLFLVLVISTPFTPIYKNTFAHLSLLGIELKQSENKTYENEHTNSDALINSGQLENLILSSREIFLESYKEFYNEAPITQKLFGMGYGGNFTQEPKMIEMDYYDIFFSLGIIGFLLYFLPFIYAGFFIIRFFIRNWKMLFTPKYTLLLSSVILILGIAFLAGHVFTAPAVSIYFSCILAFILTDLKANTKLV